MEVLERPVRVPAEGGGARLLPHALAERIRGRLAGPAQIAVEFEAQHGVVHRDRRGQEGPGLVGVPDPAAEGLRRGQAAVDADVDHDPRGPQPLRVEHPHTVARVLEPAELVHQAFGVERPALAVSGGERRELAPGVEVGVDDRRSELEMMPGHALVVDRRLLLPGVEDGLVVGHRPPHPARAGQILAGLGVVDDPGRRRGEPALQPGQPGREVEVRARQTGDRRVGRRLHPVDEFHAIMDLVLRLTIQPGERRRDPLSGEQTLRDLLLLGDDLLQPGHRPGIGVVGVGVGAQVGRQVQQVAVAADRVVVDGLGENAGAQVVGEGPERGPGRVERGGEGAGQRRVGRDRCGVAGDGVGRGVGLPGDRRHLSTGRRRTMTKPVGEAVDDVGERRRDRGEAGQEGLPLLAGVGGHEVEDVAQRLQR